MSDEQNKPVRPATLVGWILDWEKLEYAKQFNLYADYLEAENKRLSEALFQSEQIRDSITSDHKQELYEKQAEVERLTKELNLAKMLLNVTPNTTEG